MKQVIVVRTDVVMSPPKLGVQIAHAAVGACNEADRNEKDWWDCNGQKKVVLGIASEVELLMLTAAAHNAGLPRYLVRDAGKTELEPLTMTAVGIGPAPSEEIDKVTGHLKLYR
jgi:PTH2 family peptidyl-tRNA hydrolase